MTVHSAEQSGAELPVDSVAYRSLGPFTADTLPAGLRRAHWLKDGCWGVLAVESGEVGFVWDDKPMAPPVHLGPGDHMVIPPGRHHHLEPGGAFVLGIRFFRRPV